MESRNAESSLDTFAFAFNNEQFSNRTLKVKIIPNTTVSKIDPIDCDTDLALTENEASMDDLTTTQVKTLKINTAVLARKSPFFYKLFSNGMSESNEHDITLLLQESEEAAFMAMLEFIYNDTLSSTTPSALLDVLMVADKYEVASCMEYCIRLLQEFPLTCETALLYLELPSTILKDGAVQRLINASKEMLVTHFSDASKFEEELLNLPLAGLEVILSSDDLQVNSEDEIYDFVMNWSRRHYIELNKRQEILNTRLLPLIRFQYMSYDKLKELVSCTEVNPRCSSELLLEALTSHISRDSPKNARAYRIRPVKVMRFDSPHKKCVVYFDLKREECARLLPDGVIFSRDFHYGGKTFYLVARRGMDIYSSSNSFGLCLGMRETGSVIEFAVAARRKPSKKYVYKKLFAYEFDEPVAYGSFNLFEEPWDRFIAENNRVFINGVLHLKVVIKFRR